VPTSKRERQGLRFCLLVRGMAGPPRVNWREIRRSFQHEGDAPSQFMRSIGRCQDHGLVDDDRVVDDQRCVSRREAEDLRRSGERAVGLAYFAGLPNCTSWCPSRASTARFADLASTDAKLPSAASGDWPPRCTFSSRNATRRAVSRPASGVPTFAAVLLTVVLLTVCSSGWGALPSIFAS
jgi:hypothetical protein